MIIAFLVEVGRRGIAPEFLRGNVGVFKIRFVEIHHAGGRFGNGDTRARLRRFFGVDAESTVIATLYALAAKGLVEPQLVEKAIKDLGVNPEKVQPQIV
jgi:pyruvate dehydrogenase complex dehydrogenase (E1) component